jgi:hypothetical protein
LLQTAQRTVGHLTLNNAIENSGSYTNANIQSVAVTFPNSFLANSSATIGNTLQLLLWNSRYALLGNVTLTNANINIANNAFTDN